MISRVAEHCFWMARYLERAENTARIIDVNHTLLLDFHVPSEQQWMPVLIISGIHEFEQVPTAENVQYYMTWEAANPFSITSSLFWARENARIIREVISAEMWERLNYYYRWMQDGGAEAVYNANRSEFYAQVKRINQLVHGIADSTMGHGEAWEFFKLGTYLERACQTARIMDVKYHTLLPKVEDVGTPVDNAHWMAILMSCSGYEPFHKKPLSYPIDPASAVADFLIYDEQFPRSVLRCLIECDEAARAIAGGKEKHALTAAELGIADLIAWIRQRNITELIQFGMHEALTHIVDAVHRIGNGIHSSFFAAEVQPPETSKDLLPRDTTSTTQTQ